MQQLAGETSIADRNGVMVGNRILRGALPFLAQQSMAVLGTRGPAGQLWCSVLFGHPGFLQSSDGFTLDIDLSQALVQKHDVFWGNIKLDPQVGMLVIDLATRRRLRINGQVAWASSSKLSLQVKESYPNCPKYITRREVKLTAFDSPGEDRWQGLQLTDEQRESLRSADLFFVATAHPSRGIDASHRGGAPGFIEVLDARTLRIPDYPGNSMFNTLGNLLVNPKAGLALLAFERGRILQMTGRAEVLSNQSDPAHITGGTERFWTLHIEQWTELPLPPGLRNQVHDLSAFNPAVLNQDFQEPSEQRGPE